jgi:SPX domain protein involved in polyphosphate accumulation
MGSANNLFKRKEKKYLLSGEKYNKLMAALADYIVPDEYPHSTVCSMYYDTPDFKLIRASIEKPLYREKLRVRSYGVPIESSKVFLELKKKYDGVVYKRRLKMELGELEKYLDKGIEPLNFRKKADIECIYADNQIYQEINYFLKHYGNLQPMMFLSYEREAFFAKDNRDLRITFDSDITYRRDNLRLTDGIFGKKLIEPDQHLMEIKVAGAMPLWLVHILDRLEIRSSGFTKYGNAYKQELTKGQAMKGVYVNA